LGGGGQRLARLRQNQGHRLVGLAETARVSTEEQRERRPAKPGDLIVAWGVGFGDVTPTILPVQMNPGDTR